MQSFLYLGEAAGGRILRYGAGIQRLTADGPETVPLIIETHPVIPATESGDCIFRSIDATVRAQNGYAISITPIVDDVPRPTQRFNRPGTVVETVSAYCYYRGARLAVVIAIEDRLGAVEIENVGTAVAVLRDTP